jgi:RNA polymerase sigma factor (sigma-70 family)
MEKDILLINNVKEEGDIESLKELIDKHSGIYVEMVNKHIPNDLEGVNKEDLIQDKDFSIYEAAINFDENKNTKFGTYVGNLARWKCLNIYNKKVKFPQMDISDIFDTKISEEDALKKIEDKEDIEKIFSALDSVKDKRAKQIFKMRYCGDRKLTSWKKIAKKLDISIQGCINIHNKHLTEIKKYV